MRTLFFLLLIAVPSAAADHWTLDEHETIRNVFKVSAPSKLLVDNISGFIHVTGTSGTEVRISVDKRIRAESKEALEEAKRDVNLDQNQQGNFVRLYVDGPFRMNNRGDRYYAYNVSFDFEIQVPQAAEVILKTVNGGSIDLKNTSGDFELRNVNGAITLDQVSGSGSAHTVNGALTGSFAKNPVRASSFKTLNGQVDIYFQAPLSADLRFKTFNGQVFTDFEVAAVPIASAGEQSRNGRFIYKSNRMTQGRAGQGGPELSFDAFNGNIRLHTKGK